jgi:hypothetical protein
MSCKRTVWCQWLAINTKLNSHSRSLSAAKNSRASTTLCLPWSRSSQTWYVALVCWLRNLYTKLTWLVFIDKEFPQHRAFTILLITNLFMVVHKQTEFVKHVLELLFWGYCNPEIHGSLCCSGTQLKGVILSKADVPNAYCVVVSFCVVEATIKIIRSFNWC